MVFITKYAERKWNHILLCDSGTTAVSVTKFIFLTERHYQILWFCSTSPKKDAGKIKHVPLGVAKHKINKCQRTCQQKFLFKTYCLKDSL